MPAYVCNLHVAGHPGGSAKFASLLTRPREVSAPSACGKSGETGYAENVSGLIRKVEMARGPAPAWRQRLPHLDGHITAAMQQCNGKPDTETGLMGRLIIVGCDTRERAAEVKKMLYRSARHHKVSLTTDILRADDGSYQVDFSVYHKAYGRAYVLKTYGDRSNFPYDPRRKASK